MAGRLVKAQTAAITGATTAGVITVASTTGWYATAYGNMIQGANRTRCYIIEVLSSTTLAVRIIPDNPTGESTNIAGGSVVNSAPNYNRSDVSTYNGGTIYQDEQFIYNPNDAPLT